jgi:hypothetical protein
MTHLQKLCFAYLSGRVEADLFQDWFAQLYVDVANGANEPDSRAVRKIGLRLAEFTNGDLSESALKAEIRKHAGIAPVTLVFETQPQVKTGASQASFVERQVAFA